MTGHVVPIRDEWTIPRRLYRPLTIELGGRTHFSSTLTYHHPGVLRAARVAEPVGVLVVNQVFQPIDRTVQPACELLFRQQYRQVAEPLDWRVLL